MLITYWCLTQLLRFWSLEMLESRVDVYNMNILCGSRNNNNCNHTSIPSSFNRATWILTECLNNTSKFVHSRIFFILVTVDNCLESNWIMARGYCPIVSFDIMCQLYDCHSWVLFKLKLDMSPKRVLSNFHSRISP